MSENEGPTGRALNKKGEESVTFLPRKGLIHPWEDKVLGNRSKF